MQEIAFQLHFDGFNMSKAVDGRKVTQAVTGIEPQKGNILGATK